MVVLLLQGRDVGLVVSNSVDDKIFSLVSLDFIEELDFCLILSDHLRLFEILFSELVEFGSIAVLSGSHSFFLDLLYR